MVKDKGTPAGDCSIKKRRIKYCILKLNSKILR